MILFLFAFWILIVNVTNVQDAFSILKESYVRELSSLLLAGWAVIHKKDLRHKWYWVSGGCLAAYVVATVMRSDSYDLMTKWKLLVRLLTCYSAALFVPVFFTKLSEVKKVFVASLGILTLVSLSAPLQEITGPIWWMNDPESAAGQMRGGYFRYASLLGDPNVVGIIGACLPLAILVFEHRGMAGTATHVSLYCVTLLCSFMLVVVSMSFTGLMVLALSAACLLVFGNSVTRILVACGALVGGAAAVALEFKSEKISTVIDVYFGGAYYTASAALEAASPHYLPHWNPILIDLDYRLFGYLERNNTAATVFMGDSYDTVVPTLFFNPDGVLAHNGYKEFYLAGGLIGVGLLVWFVGYGFRHAIRVLRESASLSVNIRGFVRAVACTYVVCACVMIVFPVFHYPGIAALMWVSAGLLQVTQVQMRAASAAKSR